MAAVITFALLAALTVADVGTAPPQPTERVVRAFTLKQCNGATCRLARWEWREFPGRPREHYLYLLTETGQWVRFGGWQYDTCEWRYAVGSGWSDPAPLPAGLIVPGVLNPPKR